MRGNMGLVYFAQQSLADNFNQFLKASSSLMNCTLASSHSHKIRHQTINIVVRRFSDTVDDIFCKHNENFPRYILIKFCNNLEQF